MPKKVLARNKPAILITFGIIGFFLIISIGYLIYHQQIKPVVESTKAEMKDVPPILAQKLRESTSSASFRVPILMYHYVEFVQDKRDTIRQSLDIIPPVFDQQIKTLKDAGYTFLTAKDLAAVIDNKKTLPAKPILITIDDGHWDLDTVILPILKKYHAQATAYIISGFIGGGDFLSKQQLSEVVSSGLVEIGAHTVHHVSLKGKLYPIVKLEVEQSKKAIEKMIHKPVVSFAYPNGSFDLPAINAVKNAGFQSAVSTIPGQTVTAENRFFLFRLRPGGRTGQSLLSFLDSAKDQSRVGPF